MSTKELFGVVVFGGYKGRHVAVRTAHTNSELVADIQSQQSERHH
jgi:hypothetical protein